MHLSMDHFPQHSSCLEGNFDFSVHWFWTTVSLDWVLRNFKPPIPRSGSFSISRNLYLATKSTSIHSQILRYLAECQRLVIVNAHTSIFLSGWWFGTMEFWMIFHSVGNGKSSQLTNSIIFQRGRAKNHQPAFQPQMLEGSNTLHFFSGGGLNIFDGCTLMNMITRNWRFIQYQAYISIHVLIPPKNTYIYIYIWHDGIRMYVYNYIYNVLLIYYRLVPVRPQR